MGEGESADEEAHRKTDAAKKRHAIDLRPACAAGPFRDPPTVRQPDSAEDADLLAEEQAKRHAQRQWRKQHADHRATHRHARIDAPETRDRQSAWKGKSVSEQVT